MLSDLFRDPLSDFCTRFFLYIHTLTASPNTSNSPSPLKLVLQTVALPHVLGGGLGVVAAVYTIRARQFALKRFVCSSVSPIHTGACVNFRLRLLGRPACDPREQDQNECQQR